MTMKPIALALIAAFSTTPVLAADLTYAEPAPAYNEPAAAKTNWTGAYIGGHIGMQSRKLNPFGGSKGLNLGAQGGYNMEMGGAVVGGELEASHLGDASVHVKNGQIEERGRVALKGKAGIPLDQTLIYGTAGLSMTDFHDKGATSGPDGWKFGYILGAGIEQKLSSSVSAKVEYNYGIVNGVKSDTGGVRSNSNVRDHAITAGVNYHF